MNNQYEKYYRFTLCILVVLAIAFVFAKLGDTSRDKVTEVNYIGDMESENLEASNQDDEEEPEVELLEIGDNIRVLIKDDDFQNSTHDVVSVSAPSGLCIQYGDIEEIIESDKEVVFDIEDDRFLESTILITTLEEEEKITITSLERAYGAPAYYGSIELFLTEEQLVIVNDVDLEEYLYGVLPSEMPASYETEALKAQAICARSYAYCHMYTYNYPEYCAHIDDSTSYQVYNNLEESEVCNQAIVETKGEKLTYNGEVITTYFFSTSCGYTTTVEAWGEIEETEEIEETNYAYLQSVSVSDGTEDFEAELTWYQWTITMAQETMVEVLQENLVMEGECVDINILETGDGGVVLELEIVGQEETKTIEGEYNIRQALGSSRYTIVKNDGSEVAGLELLPSAFFTIEYVDGNYIIQGGGLGHGIGLSQNGANEMAKAGYNYIEILKFFYTDVEVESL